MNIRYVTRGAHAGFTSSGIGPLPVPQGGTHADRVLWLVSQIEMPGGYGMLQNCQDAAVMSGGLLHHIAVSPSDKTQGSLWGLVSRMKSIPTAPVGRLFGMIKAKGWYVDDHNALRYLSDDGKVSGQDITQEITQSPNAVVPPDGDGHQKALNWFTAFVGAFADPNTYAIQKAYSAEWLISGSSAEETAAYRVSTENPEIISSTAFRQQTLPDHTDLAMAIYHSFSANAPGIARSTITAVLSTGVTGQDFSIRLVRALGKRDYANWQDTDDDTSRYDRTRKAALRSTLWSPDLINKIMPVNL